MLKRYLLASLCLLCCTLHTRDRKEHIGKKAEHLLELQNIAHQLNQTEQLNDYLVTIPSFALLTSQDVYTFLAGIPQQGQLNGRSKKKRMLSMLGYLQHLWVEVTQNIKDGKLTPRAKDALEQMRNGIDHAFKHDITYMKKKSITSFVQQCVQNDTPLIIRPSIDHALLATKTICPVKPAELNQAISHVIKSYYYDETIEQLLEQGPLRSDLYASVIMQTLVIEDKNTTPITSGISCSYDMTTQMPGIITIESVYHHGQAIKDPTIARDRYYVHDGIVYPIIMKKSDCYEPDLHMNRVHVMQNKADLQTAASLEPRAVKKIAHITNLVQKQYERPICISFIVRDHTIYLTKLQLITAHLPEHSSYIDPLYLKKAVKDDAVSIVALTPTRDIIVLKRRTDIMFAPTLRSFLDQYKKRDDDKAVVGIIKQRPSEWTKERELLDQLPIPIIWSDRYEHIQSWIKEKKWPLIIDPQQESMFPFKRRKGFCTLFQTIENGVKEHPAIEHVSVIPSFIDLLNDQERSSLTPYEFFSGVPMEQLIELTKHAEKTMAIQVLRTILYRLSNEIKRQIITQNEQKDVKQPYDPLIIKKLQEVYGCIERVVHQLYKIVTKETPGAPPTTDLLERLFLVNILKNLIMQAPSDAIMHVSSFNTVV